MIGERIKMLRISHNLTQTQLAELLETSTSTIGMYEQGRRSPDAGRLVNICKLFGVTADFLLMGDTSKVVVGDIFEFLSCVERGMVSSGELTADGRRLEVFEILKISKAMSFAVRIILDEISKNAQIY